MSIATTLLQNRRVQTAHPKAYNGMIMEVDPAEGVEGLESAWNAGFSTSQVSTITFPNPGTLPVGGEVFINFTETDCTVRSLRLHSCDTTAPVSLATLLLAAINGVSVPPVLPATVGAIVPPTDLAGYSATAVGNVVTITGKPGIAFTIVCGGFGYTIGTVTNPAVPTTALISSASCAGNIHVGCAVVSNPALAASLHPEYSSMGSSIAADYSSLVDHPSNAPTERFLGWVVRETSGEIKVQDCCSPLNCDDDIPCHGCLHYVSTCCDSSEIAVRLEPFPAGTTVPASLIDFPVYYRHTIEAGYTKRGAPALNLSVVPNPNLSRARNKSTGAEWVIREILDPATYLVRIGVAK
jgi:hypothetical protein